MKTEVSPSLLAWLSIVVSVLGFTWWIIAAAPTPAAIAAAQTQLTPLPVVNLTVLDSEAFASRQVYGVVPIEVSEGSVGRQDPFARP